MYGMEKLTCTQLSDSKFQNNAKLKSPNLKGIYDKPIFFIIKKNYARNRLDLNDSFEKFPRAGFGNMFYIFYESLENFFHISLSS